MEQKMLCVTERELELLSLGLLAMIENTSKAKSLVNDVNWHSNIDDYVKEIQALNEKVCNVSAT